MADLYQRSIEIILQNQAPSGAYIACPNMPDYAYCWFRDGAFIAHAMDLVGEHESARRFFQWGAGVVNSRAAVVERALQKAARGEALQDGDFLHTRYTLQGEEGGDDGWPNFQLDGLGTWLWAMGEHLQVTGQGAAPAEWCDAARLAARYLAGLWRLPNYDLWEEFGDRVHPYTLAAIYGGLRAHEKISGEASFAPVAARIQEFVLNEAVCDGVFVKYLDSGLAEARRLAFASKMVDASLLGLAVPYGLAPPQDKRVQATAARIEADLRHNGGGVHRYAEDTYYGGGEWLLLAAWLGWYYCSLGHKARARALLAWVTAQADEHGNLPEQTVDCLIAPEYYERWLQTRGPVAKPLLWSHAMWLVLERAIGG